MGSIRKRTETGKLFFDFRFRGVRCREYTALANTPSNRRKLESILARIEAEITLGSFDYARYFPDSEAVYQFKRPDGERTSPSFDSFAKTWLTHMEVEWRRSHRDVVRATVNKRLIPWFAQKPVSEITQEQILEFRAHIAKSPGQAGRTLSAQRINHVMTPLRMILTAASQQHKFANPFNGIKSLRIPRTDVQPFTLEEVGQILSAVRRDFKNYYTVRFFTGMRPGEIDGLKWRYVDFYRRQILVRETIVHGRTEYTKTDGSLREIAMSSLVYDALQAQLSVTGEHDYVFVTAAGTPLDHHNVTRRVWHPLLRHLGLRPRRPYQTRHTAATLWLAAGENPEWIARQMGHTTTEMLFRVYSRFVPNLTRLDGSAFEQLLDSNLNTEGSKDDDEQ